MSRSDSAYASKKLKELILTAPLLPGCYLYKNEKGKIIYVGKAKIIRKRVKSYFQNYSRLDQKTQLLIENIRDVEFLTVDSEVEALLLEANLIKKYKPKYNILLRDDKSYVYVKIDKVNYSDEPQSIPKVSVVREKPNNQAYFFGPYPESRLIYRLLRKLRRIYPYCMENHKIIIPKSPSEKITSNNKKPCFDSQINLCNGVCAGLSTRKEYESNLKNIKKFFEGKKMNLISELERSMQKHAKKQEFEQANYYKNSLNDLKYIGRNLKLTANTDEKFLMETKRNKRERALTDLIEYLEYPKTWFKENKNFRIECYDISNFQGKYAVGSMVVFIDGEAKPELYRRFRIRMKNEPNDFAMLQEVLIRRFKRFIFSKQSDVTEYTDNEGFTVNLDQELLKRARKWKKDESFSQKPDLIIIDGGKGQLSSTYRIMQSMDLHKEIPIVGLAKREEEIFKILSQSTDPDKKEIDKEDFYKIHLPRRSEALYLVQRIRDEAHRFAITYHRKVRAMHLKKM